MDASARFRSRDAFREYLDSFDWSRQSPARVRLLEAFLRLVVAHGFESVSLRMIARAVDIKAPSIYSHFPDGKDELVAEAQRWYFHQFGTALLAEVDATETADEFWDAMVRLHFTRQLALPESNLWDLLVATDRMVGVLPDQLRSEIDTALDLHQAMYRSAAEDLGFPDSGTEVRIVVALLESATRWADLSTGDGVGAKPRPADLADHAVRLSRLILAHGR